MLYRGIWGYMVMYRVYGDVYVVYGYVWGCMVLYSVYGGIWCCIGVYRGIW